MGITAARGVALHQLRDLGQQLLLIGDLHLMGPHVNIDTYATALHLLPLLREELEEGSVLLHRAQRSRGENGEQLPKGALDGQIHLLGEQFPRREELLLSGRQLIIHAHVGEQVEGEDLSGDGFPKDLRGNVPKLGVQGLGDAPHEGAGTHGEELIPELILHAQVTLHAVDEALHRLRLLLAGGGLLSQDEVSESDALWEVHGGVVDEDGGVQGALIAAIFQGQVALHNHGAGHVILDAVEHELPGIRLRVASCHIGVLRHGVVLLILDTEIHTFFCILARRM